MTDLLPASPAMDDAQTGPPLTVLVVDDDPDIRRLLRIRLANRGFQVETAASGDEALARLDEIQPDMMLLDVSMPGSSGLDVLERIRADRRDIAVVMSTAFGSERVAIDALRRGADDYLRKPFETEEFRAVIERTASRLRLRRQNIELRRRLDEQRRHLEAELARAGRVQAGLLPDAAPSLPGYALAGTCLPTRDVGGDFYDWQLLPGGNLAVSLGDVMGKGMAAALLMATARAALRSATFAPTPAERLAAVVAALSSDLERSDAFVTLVHAELDPASGRLTYVDAGHGLGLVRRRGGAVEELAPKGPPLGVLPDWTYEQGESTLAPGDALVLYSDGLPDARPDLALDSAAMAARIVDGDAPDAAIARFVALADDPAARIDDLTLVVLRRDDGQ